MTSSVLPLNEIEQFNIYILWAAFVKNPEPGQSFKHRLLTSYSYISFYVTVLDSVTYSKIFLKVSYNRSCDISSERYCNTAVSDNSKLELSVQDVQKLVFLFS